MKKVGSSSWVGKLRTERGGPTADPAQAPGAKGAKAAIPADAPRAAAPDAALAQAGLEEAQKLALARIPEKLAKEHGPSLAVALPDATRLAAFLGGLEPWRTRAVERIVDQTYKALGLALSQAPAESRPEVAGATVAAFRALAETVGAADALAPALNAALGLFELGLRHTAQKRLESKPFEQAAAMVAAKDAVLALHARLAERPGAGTVLNVFPVLVEQLERAEPKLTPDTRQRLWSAIADLLVETGPKTGFTQEAGAELAKALGEALAAKPKNAKAALADARARYLATYELPRKEWRISSPRRCPEPRARRRRSRRCGPRRARRRRRRPPRDHRGPPRRDRRPPRRRRRRAPRRPARAARRRQPLAGRRVAHRAPGEERARRPRAGVARAHAAPPPPAARRG